MVNIPNDHFGPIPAEADPRGIVSACVLLPPPRSYLTSCTHQHLPMPSSAKPKGLGFH